MAVASESFAVLLNPNARRVSRHVLERVSEIVDPDHVYVSEHEDQAPELVERIMERGYQTVFTGGGDGTVTQFINMVPADHAPRVGILKLGTGNAMAEIVSSGDPMLDLRNYSANPSHDALRLALCEAEGVHFAFAGLGIDAWVLNDYRAMKERFTSGAFRPLLHNVGGYFAAVFGRTVPRMVKRWAKGQVARATITNAGDVAYEIETTEMGGRIAREIAPGEVLFEGPVNATMFGTCPYYGYRMRALPYAGIDPHRFHLRVSNIPVPRLLANLGKLWNGSLRHDAIRDFHADRVHVRFSEPMPYQLAGEARGFREELTVGLSRRAVDLVRFI
jgi:diacylglycerol kinase family enzyme